MWKSVVVVLGAAGAVALIGTVASAQVVAPPVPSIAVQKAHLLDPTQLAIDGTIQCQVGRDFSVTVNVTELGGQAAVRKSPAAAGPCTVNGPQAWTATVKGSGGSFVPVVTTFATITDPASQKSTVNADQRGIDITTP